MGETVRRHSLGTSTFVAVMGLGAAWIVASSLSFVDLGRGHPFFIEKQPLAHPDLWWATLCVHVPSALLSLPACLLLLSTPVRVRLPRLHRWLGRLTGALVLGAVVPSGVYLALFATGGWAGTAGFWLSGAITFVSMLSSVRYARRKNYPAHRRSALHVVGQLSVAVVSRVLLVCAEAAGLYDEGFYVAALWLPVLGSVLVVNLVSGRVDWSLSKGSRCEQMPAVSRLDAVR